MDVVGSALATSISMAACAVAAMVPFVRNKAILKFVKPRFSLPMIKQITACGSPVFLSNVSGRVTSILMNISLMALGAKAFGPGGGITAVAVYAVLMYASDFCWPLLYGISDSLSPAIGYNWGAENYDRVKKIALCGFAGTAFIGAVSTSLLFFFPGTIASLFANGEDVHLLEISTHAIRIFCFSYVFRWFCVMSQSFLSAIEKPAQATLLSVGTALVFPVLLLGALWNFGLDGIWFNFVSVNFLTTILSAFLLMRIGREIKARQQAKGASGQ
jgi:Na+-driven multidrug efflux pump